MKLVVAFTKIIILFLFQQHCFCQTEAYNYSSSKDGYSGRVKIVKYYIVSFDSLDTVSIDSSFLNKRELNSIRFYDESGLLIKVIALHHQKELEQISYYEYDSLHNLKSKITEGIHTDFKRVESYTYDHENKKVQISISNPLNIVVAGRSRKVHYKILHFDSRYNRTQIEYWDYDKEVIGKSKFKYDLNSNVIHFESFGDPFQKTKYTKSYDEKKRIKQTHFIDQYGITERRHEYFYPNDTTKTQKNYDRNGKVNFEQEVISFKDKRGNTIKKIIHNKSSNSSFIQEFDIDFY